MDWLDKAMPLDADEKRAMRLIKRAKSRGYTRGHLARLDEAEERVKDYGFWLGAAAEHPSVEWSD